MNAASNVSAAPPSGRVVWLSEVKPNEPLQMFEDVADVLDVNAVAELLGVTVKTVRREIARGRLDCFHVGRSVRITKAQLVAYVGGGQ